MYGLKSENKRSKVLLLDQKIIRDFYLLLMIIIIIVILTFYYPNFKK